MRITHLSCAAALLALGTTGLTGCTVEPPPALTIAMTATSNEPAPSTASLIELLTDHAGKALDPAAGTVTLVTPETTTTVDLTPMRGDEVEAGNARADKISDNLDSLDRTLSTIGSHSTDLDPIKAIDLGLESTGPNGHLIVLTSGFSTADPIDLNAAGDWIGAPEALVDQVDQMNLPDANGKHIAFAGLGYPAPGSAQATAGPAARIALHTVMLGLCTRMNAASCEIIPGPVSTRPSNSTTPVPTVELDQLTTHCVGQIDIDTAIAFAPESAELQRGIDTELEPIAASLAACPGGTVVDAVGHSAAVPHPSWGGGPDLEQRRAQAILDRIRVLGAPATSIGTASAGGQLIDNMPGGQYREDLAAHNRTVTLTITR